MHILYLTPGIFDKGGISRYNRFQVTALRSLYGEDAISVLSLAGHRPDDFEEPFETSWAGAEDVTDLFRGKLAVAGLRITWRKRPSIILSAHLNLGPLAWSLARIWSGL
ncbi:MAG TPA: hypothetical protein VEF33_05755, partial [Syntrophales bacterium]|nr:hypothetical protein [Syntrophales bacterium]